MKAILIAGLLALVTPALAQHGHGGPRPGGNADVTPWTTVPRLLIAGGGRGPVRLRLAGIEADVLSIHAPGGAPEARVRQVPVEARSAVVSPAAPMMGNYHWVQAREAVDGRVHVASTVVYFANPGPAPTALLAESRSELEIIPDPLPREHAHYREGERWDFLLRWQGHPLADQALTLETANGSRSRARSDAEGRVTLVFPRDFDAADTTDDGHRRPSASFVLWTERQADGRHYLSSFTERYSPEPARTRSLAWGAGFGLFGMVLAMPLLRRREARHD